MIIFIFALGVWTDARAVELIPRDVLFGAIGVCFSNQIPKTLQL